MIVASVNLLLVVRVLVFLLGLWLVVRTLSSAMRSFVLPRGETDAMTALVFTTIRRVFQFRLRGNKPFAERDRIMALYAPISLLTMPPFWLTMVAFGYMGMFWAVGTEPPTEPWEPWAIQDAFLESGSSLLTLGYASVYTLPQMILSFSEATVGLILIALLIAYLPTMYNTFSRREAAVTKLSSRAGSPPSSVEMILRMNRIGELDKLRAFWEEWETLFAEIEESHTSLAALVFFRSPQPEHSWVTAAGTVMDTAALIRSCVDVPRDSKADLCIRAGFLALQRVAAFFRVEFNPNPHYPDEPISITRAEFEAVCATLEEQGVPLKLDREQAWQDFAGWRVNYDKVLLALCALTMAPHAEWSSDRAPNYELPPIRARR